MKEEFVLVMFKLRFGLDNVILFVLFNVFVGYVLILFGIWINFLV